MAVLKFGSYLTNIETRQLICMVSLCRLFIERIEGTDRSHYELALSKMCTLAFSAAVVMTLTTEMKPS
jgi:hypothetical protein